ncbi:MAG: prepilin-type N-terminal cleavage/methylation domain-containing protein [Candidatus Omnitrophica bacterium]|nr:prepilin-type N-terminal cleavage/methylation domain-containing protein [Candidatus Omnitrophota bacterium]
MFSRKIKHINGFTLTEIMVTVIIVGVLSSVALPRFTGVFERVRAAEGVQILTALLGAQKAYEMENGFYSAILNDLDVEIDRAENFDITTIVVQNNAANVASIQRWGGYTLSIDEDGNIGCVDGAITCAFAGH